MIVPCSAMACACLSVGPNGAETDCLGQVLLSALQCEVHGGAAVWSVDRSLRCLSRVPSRLHTPFGTHAPTGSRRFTVLLLQQRESYWCHSCAVNHCLHAGQHHAAAQVHLFCVGCVVTALISAFTLGLCAAAAAPPPPPRQKSAPSRLSAGPALVACSTEDAGRA